MLLITVSEMQSTMLVSMTVSQLISENLSSTGMHLLQASISPRQPARSWEYHSLYPRASQSSITLICSIDLFACPVCNRTHKLLTSFSKNWFYLLPEPLRIWKKLTNYCFIISTKVREHGGEHRKTFSMTKVARFPFNRIIHFK